MYSFILKYTLKGTVSVISNDLPCKVGSALFTKVPLKALCNKVCIKYACFSLLKQFVFFYWFTLQKKLAHFLLVRNNAEIHRNKHFFLVRKNDVKFSTFWIRLRFQGRRCKSSISILA